MHGLKGRATLPRPKIVMTDAKQPKRNKNVYFWRACGYLAPYRQIVIISVVSAFFVGLIGTTGLGTMLPILSVLIGHQTVQEWVDQKIAGAKVHHWYDNYALRAAGMLPTDPVKTVAVLF